MTYTTLGDGDNTTDLTVPTCEFCGNEAEVHEVTSVLDGTRLLCDHCDELTAPSEYDEGEPETYHG